VSIALEFKSTGNRYFLPIVAAIRRPAIATLLIFAINGIVSPSHANDQITLRPDDPAYVSHGARIYAEHCAQCHGAKLEGQPDWRRRKPDGRLPAPPHDESGHTWHHPDTMLFELTKYGPAKLVGSGYESDMPGYEGILDEGQIVAVLSFIKSRWPDDIRRRHDQLNRAARRGN
jgi:mono/diheme cytochrome c family protein